LHALSWRSKTTTCALNLGVHRNPFLLFLGPGNDCFEVVVHWPGRHLARQKSPNPVSRRLILHHGFRVELSPSASKTTLIVWGKFSTGSVGVRQLIDRVHLVGWHLKAGNRPACRPPIANTAYLARSRKIGVCNGHARPYAAAHGVNALLPYAWVYLCYSSPSLFIRMYF
jgi:hypothetical protein